MATQKYKERGTAMLEFSIVLPVMLSMLIGLIEISSAVNQYMTISHIAYEASRYASSKAGLSTDAYNNGNQKPPSSTADWDLHARISTLLNSYGYRDSFSFTTARQQPQGSTAYSMVAVEVTVPVRPVFFRQFDSLQLKVKVTGPYLFVSS